MDETNHFWENLDSTSFENRHCQQQQWYTTAAAETTKTAALPTAAEARQTLHLSSTAN